MGQGEETGNEQSGVTPDFADLRAAPRFALLIRSAKLICGSGEYLCIIRDVSETGMRLRLFHPLPPEELLTLELATSDRFRVEKVWEYDSLAGFRFSDPIELSRFIAESGPYPKRPVRLRLQLPALITAEGQTTIATVRDLSQQGICIETSRVLALGQKVKLEVEGLPLLFATVCWRSIPSYGLVLQHVFSFEELAVLAARLQSTKFAHKNDNVGSRQDAHG